MEGSRPRDLTAAYSDLIAGALEARHDAASDRFDAELAAAESEGRLDARTSRALRWWQQESLRALVEHTRTALPPALAALDQAQTEAIRATADAAESWARAVGESMPSSAQDPSGAGPSDVRERRRRLIVASLNPLPNEE